MTVHLLRGEIAGVLVMACGEEIHGADRGGRVSGFAGRVTCRACMDEPVPWAETEDRLRRLRSGKLGGRDGQVRNAKEPPDRLTARSTDSMTVAERSTAHAP